MNFRFFSKKVDQTLQQDQVKDEKVSGETGSTTASSASDMYVLGTNPNYVDGKLYGIKVEDRIHVAVFGSTGCGKSTLVLNLIKQNIERGEGFTLVDPDGSTALKALSLIPEDEVEKLVYVDPTTAFSYGRVVQLNFLEHAGVLEKGKVARTFTDALQKIYTRYWGPRLDWILLNALYALLDAPEGSVNLADLYYILVDEEKRRGYLQHVRDDKVLDFWERAYERIPEEAASAVLTKIYRIIQERSLQPMFDCYRSSISFRKAMDEGLYVIVNLSEGKIGTELSNFLGSLILSMIYIAGMSRIDLPEEKRRPHFLYVDEAYRFMSVAMKDIIQTLRKYRVYATLVSHYLTQYQPEVAESIPALCSTIICFRVDDATARAIAPLFPGFSKDELVRLPNYVFAVSAEYKGRRVASTLKGIRVEASEYGSEDKIVKSLQKYAVQVDVKKYTFERLDDYPYPDISPVAAQVLQSLYMENRPMKFEEFYEPLSQFNVRKADVQFGLNDLIRRGFVGVYQDVDPETRKTVPYYFLSPSGQEYFRDIPQGQRGGGDRHNVIISEYVRNYRARGWFCFVDTGDVPGKKLPDILVYPTRIVEGEKGRVMDVEHWDYKNRFAVEVEIDAVKHVSPDPEKDRIFSNLEKNRLRGVKVEFVVWNEEDKNAVITSLREKLGREYDEWVKGVTVYVPTIIGRKTVEEHAIPQPEIGAGEEAVQPKVQQPIEAQSRVQEPLQATIASPAEARVEAGEHAPQQVQPSMETVSENVRRALELKRAGYSVNVYKAGGRKYLYMVPPGASMSSLEQQDYVGELSYELVKALGLNEAPSDMIGKLRFYLEKGYNVKCRSNGGLSVYPPGASGSEIYLGNVLRDGGIMDEVQQVLKDFSMELYFEGKTVKLRRVKNA